MVDNIDTNVAVLAILNDRTSAYKPSMNTEATYIHNQNPPASHEDVTETNECSKQNIIWTKDSTLTLLSLYESKIHMLDNPKKKSKMWQSMAEDLKSYNIEVTPDQVRWKINALTKKYKDSVDSGQGEISFKYFNEMHQILGCPQDDIGTYTLASGLPSDRRVKNKRLIYNKNMPFRKLREERKAKIELDKQWIEYLKRQEEQKQIRDERYERNLRLREEELQLRKKELEIKQTIAIKKLQLKEKKQEELLKIEREKCALLRKLIEKQQVL